MLLWSIIKKVLLPFVPLALFYLLRKVVKTQSFPKKKSHLPGFDTCRVVEGEIVEEKS